MYSKFTYEGLPLAQIILDDRNPRIVTQTKLGSQEAIVSYLFEHDELAKFIKKIAAEGKNHGAERPYVVKTGANYTVVEGNTRIAAYKVLSGLIPTPAEYVAEVPQISTQLRESLSSVDCSIAPNRDALLPIMANAHFGFGDKSKWGYLGSRKAVFDEWKLGKSLTQLSKAFDRTKGEVGDLILEYQLYLKALGLKWTKDERAVLLDPAVQFNPPVRFLQTRGHKSKLGVAYDKGNLQVKFADAAAAKKFQHLIRKLVISPEQGLGATATYEDVFKDYSEASSAADPAYKPSGEGDAGGGQPSSGSGSGGGSGGSATSSSHSAGGGTGNDAGASDDATPEQNSADEAGPTGAADLKLKVGALFAYEVTVANALVQQLMKEGREINCKKLPAAGTFLLRNIVESILKHIIHANGANPAGSSLDLEGSLNLAMSEKVSLPVDDKKILKEFKKTHLSYLNLGAHGTIIPNYDRAMAARDCIDQFIKRNI